jgi:hypothetical protein
MTMPDDTPPYRAEPDDDFANRLERELLQRLPAAPSTAPADPADRTLPILDVSGDDWPPSDTPSVAAAAEPELDPRTTSHRWIVVAAAAAVIVLAAAAALAYESRRDTTGPVSTDVTTTTDPPVTNDPAAYVAVADASMEAWVAGDGDAVVARIGDPLGVENSRHPDDPFWQIHLGLIFNADGTLPNPPDLYERASAIRDVAALPALHHWFRATGWQFRAEPCRLVRPVGTETPDVANVVCNYSYENDLTRAVGRPPVTERFVFDVSGDKVWTISGGMFDVDADIWQTFSEWVRSEHPDDFAAMYDANTAPPNPRLDDASIALWERHVDEFVNSPEAHTPQSTAAPTRAQFGAKARMICAAAALEAPLTTMRYGRASQNAMQQLRALPRPEEDAAEIDQLFSLLEEINRLVVADSWFHNNTFYGLQDEKVALGGRDFWGCPVGPLGG